MQKNLKNLDVKSLKEIYSRESQLLKEALLKGASWEDVKEIRRKVTELSILIHKKTSPDLFTHTKGSDQEM